MTTPPPLYRRIAAVSDPAQCIARPTRSQRALEISLFAIFGSMLLVAGVALVAGASEAHQSVPNRVAAGLAADRVNVLVLVSTSKEARDFAEALMLVSIRPSSGEVAVLSIPTDLWVRVGRYGSRRIGSAVSVGRTSGYPGRGAGLMADTVAEVFGQPVHGFVQLSPRQLAWLVDGAGGVMVTHPHGAYEARSGERFFRGRQQRLDGAAAARYALSHHVARPASDRFAREQRQQALVTALLRSPSLHKAPVGLRSNITASQARLLLSRLDGCTPRVATLRPYVAPQAVSTLAERGEVLRPRALHELQQIAAAVLR